ncbi:hypothetical protein F5Y19DRAFT_477844 [Xylariaceae sp. FL1651]|nr:hypothetical protein F5Y19DRAFT_477844 [Xylariaceae sp. FL1651]
MTPTRVKNRTWKIVRDSVGSYPKYLSSPKWIGRRLSRSKRSSHIYGRSAYSQHNGHRRYTHDSSSDVNPGLSSKKDDHMLAQDASSTPPQPSLPSTPRRPLARPGPLTPSSSKSAPATLESGGPGNITYLPKGKPKGRRSPPTPDGEIAKVLKSTLTETQLGKDKFGNNYLFEVIPANDTEKRIVKIGHTAGSEHDRLKRISNQCNHFSIEYEADPEGSPILLYKRAEKLMQAELYDFTYRFTCACRTEHREYFDVEKVTAQEVIRGWRAFCESDPYDSRGKLRPFWKHRLRQQKNQGHESDLASHNLSEQEKRRIRWRRFANPTLVEIIHFHITHTYAPVWKRGWQVLAISEALLFAILTFPSRFAFAWFVLLIVAFGVQGLSSATESPN